MGGDYSGLEGFGGAGSFEIVERARKRESGPPSPIIPPVPSFVNAGAYATATATSVTPALPASRVNGNLLVAYAHFAGSNSAVTWTVPAGWTLAASLGQGGVRPMVVAYRYVDGSEAAPVFSHDQAANSISGQVMQYTGSAASSPIGNVSSNNVSTNPITCPAIIASATNSLAVNLLVVNAATALAVSSGWSSETTTNSVFGSPTISEKTIAAQGGSSGATSVVGVVANSDNFIIEIKSTA